MVFLPSRLLEMYFCYAIAFQTETECQTLFTAFKAKFNSSYVDVNDEKKHFIVFCQNVHNFNISQPSQLYEMLDVNITQSLNRKLLNVYKTHKKKSKQSPADDCQEEYCGYSNDSIILAQIPSSIDFREKGLITQAKAQGSCGSCFIFGTIALLENSILRDQQQYVQGMFAGLTARSLNLSEQFMLSNTYGWGMYCDGGDTTTTLSYLHDFKDENNDEFYYQTLQLARDFPYSSSTVQGNKNNYKNNIKLKPVTKQYFQPFIPQYNKNFQDPNYKTPLHKIFLDETIKGKFDNKTIATIKSYLARGIAVIAGMCYSAGSSQFSGYMGTTVLNASCSKFCADHQVIFTGYGFFQGKEVWIVKNSWGSSWGSDGFFYVEIGKDSYCIEHYAFALESTYLKYRKDGNQVFNGSFESAFPQIVRGQSKYLDTDVQGILSENLAWPGSVEYYKKQRADNETDNEMNDTNETFNTSTGSNESNNNNSSDNSTVLDENDSNVDTNQTDTSTQLIISVIILSSLVVILIVCIVVVLACCNPCKKKKDLSKLKRYKRVIDRSNNLLDVIV